MAFRAGWAAPLHKHRSSPGPTALPRPRTSCPGARTGCERPQPPRAWSWSSAGQPRLDPEPHRLCV